MMSPFALLLANRAASRLYRAGRERFVARRCAEFGSLGLHPFGEAMRFEMRAKESLSAYPQCQSWGLAQEKRQAGNIIDCRPMPHPAAIPDVGGGSRKPVVAQV